MTAIYIIGAIVILILMYYGAESGYRRLSKSEHNAVKTLVITFFIFMIVSICCL